MKKTALILCLVVFASCRQKSQLRQAADSDLTIQVAPLKGDGEDDHTITYQARLIPEKKLLESKSKDEKQALYYTMDSCFYLLDGQKKIYAALVQPVANGVSGSYEYLVEFETDKPVQADMNMIYQDRYLNKKTYLLKPAGE